MGDLVRRHQHQRRSSACEGLHAMTLLWRQPQLSHVVHLAEPDQHRALCGADVLAAFTDAEAPRHMACTECLNEADLRHLRHPPFIANHARDTATRALFCADRKSVRMGKSGSV